MQKDMLSGHPAKVILLFSLPMIVGNLFQQLYVMVDTVILNRALGESVLSAVGCTGTIKYWVTGIVTGFVTGLCVVISQYFGARDEEGVKRGFAASIILGGSAAVIVTLVSLLVSRPLLVLLQTPPEILENAVKYLHSLFGGIGTSVVFYLAVGLIRALGDSRRALYFLILMFLLNTALDYGLICLLGMDVAGIGLATVISQLLAGIGCFVYIRRKVPDFSVSRRHFIEAKGELRRCLRIALPMGFQTPIVGIGLLALQYAINLQGTDAQTAYTAATRIEDFAEAIFISLGVTICTYVAQNYGAGKIDRIRKGVFHCLLISMGVCLFFLGVHVFVGPALLGDVIGIRDEKVVQMASSYLVYLGIANLSLLMIYVYRNALQGLGRTVMPVLSGFMESAMRIFVALALVAPLAFNGVKLAHPLAWTAAALMLLIAYFQAMRGKKAGL